MSLKVGDQIWLPCEVKPGPFSNERLARIQLPSEPWIGFVDVQALKDPVERGNTLVLAQIVEVEKDFVKALVQGHSFSTRQVHASRAEVHPVVSLPA